MSENETVSSPVFASPTAAVGGIWWWVLIRGILAVAFGVIALLSPVAAIAAVTIVFGAYAIVDGVVAVVHAVQVRNSFKHWVWLLVQGILSVLAGLAALILPGLIGVLGGLVIIWTVAFWTVMSGVSGIRSAAGAESGSGRTWGIVSGVMSVVFGIVLGILIVVTPAAALLGFVWLVGVYAIVLGLMLVITAIQVRVTGAPQAGVTV